MHVECACRGGYVSGIFRQDLLDMLPLEPIHRQRQRFDGRARISLIATEGHDHFVRVRRFRQVVNRTRFDRFHSSGHAGESGQHDNANAGIAQL